MNKTKLITALRLTATALENSTFNYDWNKQEACNCGSLACALLGKTRTQLAEVLTPLINKPVTTWTQMVGTYCPVTGVPTEAIFKALFDFGLTPKDIVDLEYMKNEKVISRMVAAMPKPKWWQRKRKIFYDERKHAAAYMRAWADLLAEELKQDVATPTATDPLPANL